MESLGDILRRVVKHEGEPLPPVEELQICPACHGSGWVTDRKTMRESEFTKTAAPCRECSMEYPDSLESFNLAIEWPDLTIAKEAVYLWTQQNGPALLALSAERGRGKTHLALAARNTLLRSRQDVWYTTDRQLDAVIRKSFDTNTTDQVLRDYSRQPWLIIDDYGLIARSDTMAGLMDDLINERWIRARDGETHTLLTHNLHPDEMTPRTRSRLADATRARTVVIDAEDYRLKKREE